MTVELEERVEQKVSPEDKIPHIYCPECQETKDPLTEVLVAWCGYRRPPRPTFITAVDEEVCVMCKARAPIRMILTCWQCGARLFYLGG